MTKVIYIWEYLEKMLVIHQLNVDKWNYNGYQWIITSNYKSNSRW